MTAPPRPHLAQRALQAVPTGPTQSWQPSGHTACAARAKAATLLSLRRVAPRGPEPRPEGLGHLPTGHLAHQKLPLTGPRGSAAKGDERSPPAAGPKGIPRPEGARRPACTRRGPSRPHSLPSQRFHALFDSLSKVLFIFPSRYLFAIGLVPIFSFRRSLPPILGCTPKQPDSWKAHRDWYWMPRTGLSPSTICRSRQFEHLSIQLENASRGYNSPLQATEILSLSCSRFTRRYWGNPC